MLFFDLFLDKVSKVCRDHKHNRKCTMHLDTEWNSIAAHFCKGLHCRPSHTVTTFKQFFLQKSSENCCPHIKLLKNRCSLAKKVVVCMNDSNFYEVSVVVREGLKSVAILDEHEVFGKGILYLSPIYYLN